MLLGEDHCSNDKDVASYNKRLREAGGIVNRVIAAAKGIVSYKNPKEHGGPLSLERSWAESVLGYVKRKAMKAARKLLQRPRF